MRSSRKSDGSRINSRFVRELDLEGRVFFNSKLPEKPNSDREARKYDFVIDYDYNTASFSEQVDKMFTKKMNNNSCNNMNKYNCFLYDSCCSKHSLIEITDDNDNQANESTEIPAKNTSKNLRGYSNAISNSSYMNESSFTRVTKKRKALKSGKSSEYKILQCKIYNFLERPRGWRSGLYHTIVFATVFICLILSVLATVKEYETIASSILMHTEMVIVIWLTIELTLRIWSAGCRSRYQTWKGRLKFMKNVFVILDMVVIIASISLTLTASSQNKNQNFATATFRGLRFFQILRMLRVDRRGGTWKLLGTVVWAHRQELITTLYIGFLTLIVSSFIMYLLEKDETGSKIKTYADSIWWGVITLCTIGYGDVVPVTWAGKLLAGLCALCGISFFALPAGILGSGFALKVQAMQRQKHLIRRRAPAANLIQSLWRCYAADENSLSVATWKIHKKSLSASTLSSSTKQNVSFLNRVTSLKRRSNNTEPKSSALRDLMRNQLHTTPSTNLKDESFKSKDQRDVTSSKTDQVFMFINSEPQQESSFYLENSAPSTPAIINGYGVTRGFYSDENDCSVLLNDCHQDGRNHFNPTQRVAIRAIRKIKYFVSRRKFREALRPYDVTDVIEQYSAGNLDMLARIKSLQFRLDKILGTTKTVDCYDASNISLASRIVNVESQMNEIDSKFDTFVKNYNSDIKTLIGKLNTLALSNSFNAKSTSPTDALPMSAHMKTSFSDTQFLKLSTASHISNDNIKIKSILIKDSFEVLMSKRLKLKNKRGGIRKQLKFEQDCISRIDETHRLFEIDKKKLSLSLQNLYPRLTAKRDTQTDSKSESDLRKIFQIKQSSINPRAIPSTRNQNSDPDV